MGGELRNLGLTGAAELAAAQIGACPRRLLQQLELVAAAANVEHVAIAATAELELDDGKAPRRIKLLPMGQIDMRDGRGPYHIRDIAHAKQIIAATAAFFGAADMPGDRDHQMLWTNKPGGPAAPATAWVKTGSLTAETDGIYANDVEWTAAAAQQIEAREYRYISPTFFAAKENGDVLRLKNFALVNIGAIDLPAIAAGLSGEDHVDLTAIAAALGLPADATVEQIAAAAAEAKTAAAPQTSAIAIAAGLAGDASVEEIAAAVGGLKKPDLSGYVPKNVADGMQDRLKKLEDKRLGDRADEIVAAGLATPDMRTDVFDWLLKDEGACEKFYAKAPKIVAAGAVLDGRKPDEKVTTLTSDQVAACAAMGMSHDEFLVALNEGIA